jgi:soluble lytic murein transglycosylase
VKKLVLPLAVLAALVLGALYVVDHKPGWYVRAVYPLKYREIVRGHAAKYRLDGALLAAVIYAESKFHPTARSSAGAIGLMQLLPVTGEAVAVRTGGKKFVDADLLNPEINVRYGSWYLRNLLDRYRDERLALAAYNAGQANVDRWVREGGVIGFPETRAYVARVEQLKALYRRGYGDRLGPVRPSVA